MSLDDFGSYAGDAIDDAWQVQYFGQPPNPNAGPNVDFSGTGQTNLFKYVAGLNPLDPTSRFLLRIAAVPGQPTQRAVTFSPRFSDRTYTVQSKLNLTAGSWTPLSSFGTGDNGTELYRHRLHGHGSHEVLPRRDHQTVIVLALQLLQRSRVAG